MRFAPIPFFQNCILLSLAASITKKNPASDGHMADLMENIPANTT